MKSDSSEVIYSLALDAASTPVVQPLVDADPELPN